MNARLPLVALLLAVFAASAAAQEEAVAPAATMVRVARHQPAMRHTGARTVFVVATAKAVEASARRSAAQKRLRADVHFRR